MSRPVKYRKVCSMPNSTSFYCDNSKGEIVMSVEEYEALRLIDYKFLTQEEASVEMQVARTTLQRIYDSARKKVAKALVESLVLRINGGSYELCKYRNNECRCGRCCLKKDKI